MSARRSRTRILRTSLSFDRWPLVGVTGLYAGMVLVSVQAGADGYWLGFANGAGLIAILGLLPSCASCSPARYVRPPAKSTAGVWLPEQRTAVSTARGAARGVESPDRSSTRSS